VTRLLGRRPAAILWIAVLALAIGIGAPHAALAQSSDRHHFDIPAGDLGEALTLLGQQAEREVVFSADIARGKRCGAVRGDLTAKEALDKLLAKSGLTYRLPESGPVVVEAFPDPLEKGGPTAGSSSERPDGKTAQIEEVIVTAQKREERLQDVPVPVTSLNAQNLALSSQLRIQDYYSSIPGLNIAPGVSSEQILSIRGITTGAGTNPTVGITVDDVPYGASTNLGGGNAIPDIDPGDLARVEVLRGPQGTLYGASSMGGLLKFVTVDPSTDGFSGRVQAGTESVHNDSGLGYNFRASVNVPLSETFAIRASGFTRLTPGYIDNPGLGTEGVNQERASGGRLSGLWKMAEGWSLKVSALYQDSKSDGSNDVDVPTKAFPQTATLGDLQQIYIAGTGGFDRKVQAYDAVLRGKLGGVDLISVTGYNINSYSDSFDYSYALGGLTKALFGVTGTPLLDNSRTNKFSEEVRLSGEFGTQLGWLLGGFYTDERSYWSENVLATNPTTGAQVANALYLSFPQTYSEYAGFADLTYYVTDQFDVQLGAREGEIRETSNQVESGPYTPLFVPGSTSPLVYPTAYARSGAFTYLVTPRFKLTPDVMVYARVASGYRAGGPNLSPGGVVPNQYAPDKTKNYELGLKADFLDHAISIDSSLYYIDWTGIQLHLVNPTTQLAYTLNGSRAKSDGIEVSAQARPTSWATLGAWVVWDDAALTQDLPTGNGAAYGLSGDRLPYSSRFSGNLSFDVDVPLSGRVHGLAGGTLSYVGERLSVFNSLSGGMPLQRQVLPAYARTDLHAGARFDDWTVTAFVTNLTDRRGVLNGGTGYTPPFGFLLIQPRTVGVSVMKSW
jgi:iron complex outermembrane receptor protein